MAFPHAIGMHHHSPNIRGKEVNAMSIFHYNRRDAISKTFFDIFKLIFVAGCISGFFQGFNLGLRIGIYGIVLVVFCFGIFICPKSKKEN